MDKKTMAIVAYITFIGLIVSYVQYGSSEKSSLSKFHIKQSAGLQITWLIIWVLQWFVYLPWLFYWLFSLLGLGIFILAILGIINAANEKETPLPIVGDFFDKNINILN